MPIYEYRCHKCGKKSSFLTRSVYAQIDAVCSHCGSKEMERVITTFAYHKSAQGRRSESSGQPPFGSSADYYKDPSNIGRHVEESFEKYGVDVPDSVKETIAAAREGEMPAGLDL